MSNLFVALFLTTVTGAIFYLVGLLFGKIWLRSDIRLLRFQMVAMQFVFLIPVISILFYMGTRTGSQTAGGAVDLFYGTPEMRRQFAFLGIIWLLLFVGLLLHKIYLRWQHGQKFRGNIPEEDERTKAIFQEICEEFGIAGKVSLCRNDSIRMPCIIYSHVSHGYEVTLPLECYTEKETAAILYHELCHYLKGDLHWKTVGCIVDLLHGFNPAAQTMLEQLDLIYEEYCDRFACEKGAGRFSREDYFETILRSLSEDEKRERYNLFLLVDSMTDYERRVRYMRENRKHEGFKRKTVVVLLTGLLLISSIITLIACEGAAVTYKAALKETNVRIEENADVGDAGIAISLSDEDILEEYTREYDLDPEKVVMVGEDEIERIGDFWGFNWDIKEGDTFMTNSFHKDVGSMITVTIIETEDSLDNRYQMGIIGPDGFMRYVEGVKRLSYAFDIKISGDYRFFVYNSDPDGLSIKGTVIK